MTFPTSLRALVVSTTLILACSSAATVGPVEAVDAQQANESIGFEGGIVMTADGSSVRVPGRALGQETMITIASDPTAPSPSDGTPVGHNYLLGPEGQPFASPVTVTLAFDPTLLDPGETASDIVVYTAPRESQEYTALETTVVDSRHVSVTTSHFSHFVPLKHALHAGEYESVVSNIAESPYIGDWRNLGGYVLGYLVPHARIYAKLIDERSVYGLVVDSHYGAWDHGHHCGWVSLDKVSGKTAMKGSGSHSSVADSCPDPYTDHRFTVSHHLGQPTGIFRKGSWIESDGNVQPALVLPTCTDLNVYANYDPETHTFHDVDGREEPLRGTTSDPAAGEHCGTYEVTEGSTVLKATAGYCGFGTRFVSADGYAVEIKDTKRAGSHHTSFGFMHAECIAGSLVGNPAGGPPAPPPPPPPPTSGVCCAVCSNLGGQAYYAAEISGASCAEAAATFCAFDDRGSVVSYEVGTCPIAPL
jgi:hypothetical protein